MVDGKSYPFWLRVQDQAVESYTMKEVFDMDSSVRVEAIENLGKTRLCRIAMNLVMFLSVRKQLENQAGVSTVYRKIQ